MKACCSAMTAYKRCSPVFRIPDQLCNHDHRCVRADPMVQGLEAPEEGQTCADPVAGAGHVYSADQWLSDPAGRRLVLCQRYHSSRHHHRLGKTNNATSLIIGIVSATQKTGCSMINVQNLIIP